MADVWQEASVAEYPDRNDQTCSKVLEERKTMDKLLYTAKAHVQGGRNGNAKTSDGAFDMNMRGPVERGGPGGGVNPEQLFAVGFAACFESAMRHRAQLRKIEAGDASIDSKVHLFQKEEGGYKLGVEFDISMPSFTDPAAIQDLLEDTHRSCPYSNATRGNIEVKINVNGRTVIHDVPGAVHA